MLARLHSILQLEIQHATQLYQLQLHFIFPKFTQNSCKITYNVGVQRLRGRHGGELAQCVEVE